eukprot:1391148-Amorphochlora_amoeboformis.AAC.1
MRKKGIRDTKTRRKSTHTDLSSPSSFSESKGSSSQYPSHHSRRKITFIDCGHTSWQLVGSEGSGGFCEG